MKQRVLIFVILGILILPLVYPYLQRGVFPTHDGEWAIVRLAEMHRELRDGQIPPRWSGYLNHGYGYPLFLFNYPFPYYVTEVFHLLGLGLIDAIKTGFMLSVIGSVLVMYLWIKSMWGRAAAVVSTIMFLYAPYRIVNLFIRGSLGESIALVFFPLLFWLIQKLIKNPSPKLVILTALAGAAFILTHNATVVLFAPVLLAWVIYQLLTLKSRQQKSLLYIFGTGVLTLLLAAYFWIPLLAEKKYIALSITPLADKIPHFVSLLELLSSDWHFGTRPPLHLGIMVIILATLGIVGLLFNKKSKSLGIFLLLVSGATLVLTSVISLQVWQLPLLKEIDFPWRVLEVLTFLLAVCGGAVVKLPRGRLIAIIGCVLLLFSVRSYIQTRPIELRTDDYYETNDGTTTSADELMPIWVALKPKNRPMEKAIFKSMGNVNMVTEKSNQIDLDLESAQDNILVVNEVYFPGWRALIDGKEHSVGIEPVTGLIAIPVSSGKHQVQLYFSLTPARLIGDLLSLTGIVSLGILWIFSKKLFRT